MRRVFRRPAQRGATRAATHILLDFGEGFIDVCLIDAPASAVDDHLALQVDLRTRD